MPNDYFQFKQFTVHQHKTAMKVCTDACLFGAFVANAIQKIKEKGENGDAPKIENILDIGAGTGLLSLMLAQKTEANIDAVEMDEHAFEQAQENVNKSPWKDRVTVYHSAIQEYHPITKYDLIISNPPFFQNDLKSDDSKRNLALHSEALSLEELIENIKRLLKPTASFAILLPFHRCIYFEELATKHQYFLQQKLLVKQTEMHKPFRSMLWYGTQQTPGSEQQITIKKQAEYTAEFISLLTDYYLYL